MSQLPTGTLTLLFTDIEGSTLLLQQLGERYAEMLATCRQLLRTAFQHWNGVEVDTQGDAFFVVFARASDAVSAVVDMQRAMASHTWPNGAAVALRIGLHTGEPSRTAEGYIGLDVHHAARMMSVGHGGQVLLSQTTRELVKHTLPEGVSLRDLGEHRLKDVQRPGHLYQLIIEGLPADFPPLKTLGNSPNNLPVQSTALIGREKEVAALLHLLQREEVRLLTLTGPGGTGKTRLGLQVAAELSDLFPDGVYFVNLAPISDPTLVVSTIAQTLDLKETGAQPLLDMLKASLNWKPLLLLLDNFEQVVNAAVYVAELLTACSLLKVIVTSRASLHVRGEQSFAVPPLAVPDPTRLPDLLTLSQYEAVSLFIQRAQAIKPEFQLTNANAQAVAEICVRLDGLPLAIELAAARIKLFPPQALLARLGQRLAVLTSGPHDAPARQQTLRSTLAWSYDLLTTQEQQLFRRLSIFVGGCTLEAIEALCVALGQDDGAEPVPILEGVSSLLDKSLVQQTEQHVEEPHLLMLETIREYGLECLVTCGELELARQAHADYYLKLAEEAQPELGGPQQVKWLEWLDGEHDNLRAAMQWLLDRGKTGYRREMALRLGTALQNFWWIRGHYSEGRNFLEQALTGSEGVAASVRAKALYTVARLATTQGNYQKAENLCEESLALFRKLEDQPGVARSLYLLGVIAWNKGNLTMARTLGEEALILFGEVGNKDGIGAALFRITTVISEQGEYEAAHTLFKECLKMDRESGSPRGTAATLWGLAKLNFVSQGDSVALRSLLEESLALYRAVGDKGGIADCLYLSGWVVLLQGNAVAARSLAEESILLYKETADRPGIAQSLALLAEVQTRQGDRIAARALFDESLALARKGGDTLIIVSALEGLAGIVAVQEEPTWAVRLWGAAEALREAMGAPIPLVYRASYERSVAAACAHLDEQAFAISWAEGRAMSPEQALAAEGQPMLPTQTPAAKSATTSPGGLSARELEVLRLLAQGLTDAQIAEQLVLSLHTIHAHLRTIYSKLGVTSRSAATRYAFEHQLV